LAGLCRPAGTRGLRTCLLDRYWDLVFKLYPVAEAIVDVEVWYLVCARGGITVADPTEVDLPMSIPRSFRVVGAEWRTALSLSGSLKEKQQRKRDDPGPAADLAAQGML